MGPFITPCGEFLGHGEGAPHYRVTNFGGIWGKGLKGILRYRGDTQNGAAQVIARERV